MRRWAVLAIAIGALAIVYAVFSRKSESERISARLDELAEAVAWQRGTDSEAGRAERVQSLFADLFTRDFAGEFPDLSPASRSRSELLALALGATREATALTLRFHEVRVRLNDERSASVRADATLTLDAGDRFDKLERHTSSSWLKDDGRWRISAFTVAPPDHDQPEARP